MSEWATVGVTQTEAAFERLKIASNGASRRAADRVALAVQVRAKQLLSKQRHAPGTPTPSRPGEPPALISGLLRNSVTHQPPVPEGFGKWEVQVAPEGVVYARIQELGGFAGRGDMTYIPARPYMRPAVREIVDSGIAEAICIGEFSKAQFEALARG